MNKKELKELGRRQDQSQTDQVKTRLKSEIKSLKHKLETHEAKSYKIISYPDGIRDKLNDMSVGLNWRNAYTEVHYRAWVDGKMQDDFDHLKTPEQAAQYISDIVTEKRLLTNGEREIIKKETNNLAKYINENFFHETQGQNRLFIMQTAVKYFQNKVGSYKFKTEENEKNIRDVLMKSINPNKQGVLTKLEKEKGDFFRGSEDLISTIDTKVDSLNQLYNNKINVANTKATAGITFGILMAGLVAYKGIKNKRTQNKYFNGK